MTVSSSEGRPGAASAPLPRLITKAEYAAKCERSPSAVSHWIASGRLRAPALVGQGRYAKIDWRLADRMLAEELDTSQQLAQATAVGFDDVDEDDDDELIEDFRSVPASRGRAAPAQQPVQNEDRRRQLKARADREEHAAQLAQIQLQKESGRWMEVDAATRAWAKQSATIIDRIEGSFSQLAEELAAAEEKDARSIQVALRAWFRSIRSLVAKDAEAFAADPDADAGLAETADAAP